MTSIEERKGLNSLVYDFLLKTDLNLAKQFQQRTNAVAPTKGLPTLYEIFGEYCSCYACEEEDSSEEPTPVEKKDSSSSDDSSSEVEQVKKPVKKLESSSEDSSDNDEPARKKVQGKPGTVEPVQIKSTINIPMESSSSPTSSVEEPHVVIRFPKPKAVSAAVKMPTSLYWLPSMAAKKTAESSSERGILKKPVPSKAVHAKTQQIAAQKKEQESSSFEESSDEYELIIIPVKSVGNQPTGAITKEESSSEESSSEKVKAAKGIKRKHSQNADEPQTVAPTKVSPTLYKIFGEYCSCEEEDSNEESPNVMPSKSSNQQPTPVEKKDSSSSDYSSSEGEQVKKPFKKLESSSEDSSDDDEPAQKKVQGKPGAVKPVSIKSAINIPMESSSSPTCSVEEPHVVIRSPKPKAASAAVKMPTSLYWLPSVAANKTAESSSEYSDSDEQQPVPSKAVHAKTQLIAARKKEQESSSYKESSDEYEIKPKLVKYVGNQPTAGAIKKEESSFEKAEEVQPAKGIKWKHSQNADEPQTILELDELVKAKKEGSQILSKVSDHLVTHEALHQMGNNFAKSLNRRESIQQVVHNSCKSTKEVEQMVENFGSTIKNLIQMLEGINQRMKTLLEVKKKKRFI